MLSFEFHRMSYHVVHAYISFIFDENSIRAQLHTICLIFISIFLVLLYLYISLESIMCQNIIDIMNSLYSKYYVMFNKLTYELILTTRIDAHLTEL